MTHPLQLDPDGDGVYQPVTGLVEQTNDEYHSGPGISKSHLDTIWSSSPRHYWHKYLNPNREPEEKTEALILGDAIHSAVLEPDLFTKAFVMAPEEAPARPTSRQVNAKKPSESSIRQIAWWRDFDKEHAGRTVLRVEHYKACLAIRDAVHAHELAGPLLRAPGRSEQSFYAIDPETSELIKCRIDRLQADGSTVIDVKSTSDASPSAFGRSCADYRYPVQQAWYNRVLDTEFGEHPETWAFLAVEKDPPYAIGIYFAEPEVLARAEIAADRDFQRIVDCRRKGLWPDYGESPLPMAIPNWSKF